MVLDTKPDYLSSNPGQRWWKKRPNSWNLTSDLQRHAMEHLFEVCVHVCTHTQIR